MKFAKSSGGRTAGKIVKTASIFTAGVVATWSALAFA
jgi:hypothetical protein